MSSSKGKLIILDGGEGSGKDTQVDFLRTRFADQGDKFYFTREPGGSPLAEDIRAFMLKTEEGKAMSVEAHFASAWTSRAHHLETVIKPKLKAGITVFCNRADSSTFAYQVYGQDGKHLENAFWLMRKGIYGDCVPDLYIWLHVTAEVSMQRVAARSGEVNHFDTRESDFHKKVRQGYEDFFRKHEIPHIEIDGSGTREEVGAAIDQALAQMIG